MPLRRSLTLLALTASLAACRAPDRIAGHRSPLVEVPSTPMTPEARPAPVPERRLADAQGEQPDSAPGTEPPPVRAGGPGPSHPGEAVAATAREYVGAKVIHADGRRFPSDCTGLVRAVYARHGIDLFADGGEAGDNGVTAIYRFASRTSGVRDDAPRPGDIVFFRETYDRNRDGRRNDGLTHVGIVDSVESDGTVNVIHRVARGVVVYKMNVARPHERRDPETGRTLNDYLREGRHKQRLAGELFAGYSTLLR